MSDYSADYFLTAYFLTDYFLTDYFLTDYFLTDYLLIDYFLTDHFLIELSMWNTMYILLQDETKELCLLPNIWLLLVIAQEIT
jgi:hypothetical protein